VNRTGLILTVGGSQQLNTTYTYDALNRLTGMAQGTVTAHTDTTMYNVRYIELPFTNASLHKKVFTNFEFYAIYNFRQN